MTEERINSLRHADANLRDALKMDEAELPQMPVDLNERLMQRMVAEQHKPRRIVVWPWIAAACVAGVMMIWLKPPASPPAPLQVERGVVAKVKPKVEAPVVNKEETPKVEEPAKAVKAIKTVRKAEKPREAQTPKVSEPAEIATPAVPELAAELAMAETAKPQEKTVTLTERDIPITRPENYHYTTEEIALMKKQANEAYLKWAQLELEIAKHNLEQTAQQ